MISARNASAVATRSWPLPPERADRLFHDLTGLADVTTSEQHVGQGLQGIGVTRVLTAVEVAPLLDIAPQLVFGLVEPPGHRQYGAEVEPIGEVVLVRLSVTRRRIRAGAAIAVHRPVDLTGAEQEVAEIALGRRPLRAPVAVPALGLPQFPHQELFRVDETALFQETVRDVEWGRRS
nr:hypothetical protein [Microbispora sp. CSR-4]